jgi:uncharacterized protein (DUF58 family)
MDIVGGKTVDRGIHILHLPPGATVTQSYPILLTRRGRHRIEGLKLQTRFPFGLFIKGANLPLSTDLVAYPELRPLPEGLFHDLAVLGHDQAISRRGQGVGLYNLREYQPGDESRAIHWKISARQARLIVRETETEDLQQITLALPVAVPAGERPEFFEEAISLTASLAAYFHEEGFAMRLLVGDLEIPHGVGKEHLYQMLYALAICDPIQTQSVDVMVPDEFRTLGGRTVRGEITMVVLPWPDPILERACGGASRVIRVWDRR